MLKTVSLVGAVGAGISVLAVSAFAGSADRSDQEALQTQRTFVPEGDPRDRIQTTPITLDEVEVLEPQGVPDLWLPSTPIQNPYSESKRVLGKILFWDEQLSSDNTVSCGTCHIPSAGGADPRFARNPGPDAAPGTPDDVFGSPGVHAMDETMSFLRHELFGLEPQVTPRVAQNNLMSMYPGSLFWDGRAEFSFVDPETGNELFQSGVAALEIQSMEPVLSAVEMSHQGRTWGDVKGKLANIRPLALATSIPQDMSDAIEARPSYPELFEDAFGDDQISAVRISFAIATYQRTLIPNETPWDLWNAGDMGAMTQDQIEGFSAFNASACGFCHAAPTFSNADFIVDGVRPPSEDLGRQLVTGISTDRGRFKTPSIRNAGLRVGLMHTGRFASMDDILDFYAHRNGRAPFPDNLNFLLRNPIVFDPALEPKVNDFLTNALIDPRVANEEFPFDRPTLYSERIEPNPMPLGGGTPGSSGSVPVMIAPGVPNVGNTDFRVGVGDALGGASATLVVSQNPPVNGLVPDDVVLGPITLSGDSISDGVGTMPYPIVDNPSLDGSVLYMQWIVQDQGALGGVARSDAIRVSVLCTEASRCTVMCEGDFNGDGMTDFFDLSAFLSALAAENQAADLNADGQFDFFDLSRLLSAMSAGCP